ncbi:MAG: ABC transporter ATP-binding protein, partial [Alphaproteobacteria bacterium]
MSNKKCILSAKNISKSYSQGKENLYILQDANLEIYENEVIALVGESGSGKTTFLQILGLLDNEHSGQVMIRDKNYTSATDYQRTICRRQNIGFIYQAHNLLSEFSAIENISLPLLLNNSSALNAKKVAISLMQELGIDQRKKHFPTQLSGGEQQRVAIARSLVHNPLVVLADEPTGNLDPNNASSVFDLFINFVKKHKTSALVVTHNLELAKKMDRII